MLRLVLAVSLWLVTDAAHADSVVFVSSQPRRAEWASALTKELAVYGMSARVRHTPDARSPLERAALAQRLARNLGASAAIWIETELPDGPRVRAVSHEGEYVAEALLPQALTKLAPHVFASFAASVLLDALKRTARVTLACKPTVMLSLASACLPDSDAASAWMPPWSSAPSTPSAEAVP